MTETLKELDTSGGKALNQRRKLSHALAAVEAGRAEAIVLAYRDRMDSSITTGSELCERMDAPQQGRRPQRRLDRGIWRRNPLA